MQSLTTAIGNYGLTKPLKEGRVDLGSLNLQQIEVNPITAARGKAASTWEARTSGVTALPPGRRR